MIDLYGEHGVLEFIHQKVQERKHLVIVVAEGAGAGVQDMGELVSQAVTVDESGNKKLPVLSTISRTLAIS